jgi:hypothetical protein
MIKQLFFLPAEEWLHENPYKSDKLISFFYGIFDLKKHSDAFYQPATNKYACILIF